MLFGCQVSKLKWRELSQQSDDRLSPVSKASDEALVCIPGVEREKLWRKVVLGALEPLFRIQKSKKDGVMMMINTLVCSSPFPFRLQEEAWKPPIREGSLIKIQGTTNGIESCLC